MLWELKYINSHDLLYIVKLIVSKKMLLIVRFTCSFIHFKIDCLEENDFDCQNRKHVSGSDGCLSPSVICDGKKDCGNNNDENFCGL